jgi:OPA family glycerol-3-phosphate transporter-like MFS transporter
MAARLGGPRAGATAAGLIDTAGYLGALACGSVVGRVVAARGWGAAFAGMTAVAAVTLAVAMVFAVRERRGRVESPP